MLKHNRIRVKIQNNLFLNKQAHFKITKPQENITSKARKDFTQVQNSKEKGRVVEKEGIVAKR